jgi:hypothetical protein
VNSAIGTVVKIIYDDDDTEALINKNQLPPPKQVIVHFPSFRGRSLDEEDNRNQSSSTIRRSYPFEDHHLMDIYSQKFSPNSKAVPMKTKKLQTGQFYRKQFPIDNSENLTVHRAQGQTFNNCSVAIHLGLESPENHVPLDAGSIVYVACTRVEKLKDLLVDPIFPTIWANLGKSDRDVARREHEAELMKNASRFAAKLGIYTEFLREKRYKPDYSGNSQEWEDMKKGLQGSMPANHPLLKDVSSWKRSLENEIPPVSLKPAESKRYIGIDQGIKTFSIVAVDKLPNQHPNVVAAQQFDLTALRLGSQEMPITAENILYCLRLHTPLLHWMQVPGPEQPLPRVDRVIVLLERMSAKNKNSKAMNVRLGQLLQREVDLMHCIVRISSPHLHRQTGPMFKLGDDIVQHCELSPAQYNYSPTLEREIAQKFEHHNSDSNNSDEDGSQNGISRGQSQSAAAIKRRNNIQLARKEYHHKKNMSVKIWKYFISASKQQQEDMQVLIENEIQQWFSHKLQSHPRMKLDDYGDALLHALNGLLCGSSNYQQLLPTSPILHNNRSIILTILPSEAYFVSLNCSWEKLIIEDIQKCPMVLSGLTYKDTETIEPILKSFPPNILDSLMCWDVIGSNIVGSHATTSQIRIIVKQLKGHKGSQVNGPAAGALTNTTVQVMEEICDLYAPNSSLCSKNTRSEGYIYRRTCNRTGRKSQIRRSTGKHTNSILACLEWMKENASDFVIKRPLRMGKRKQMKFINALCALSEKQSMDRHIERVQISDNAAMQFQDLCNSSKKDKLVFSDLILIGLNDNQQYVSAISSNYRQRSQRIVRTANPFRRQPNQQHQATSVFSSTATTPNVCICSGPRNPNCKSIKHIRLTILVE